MEMAAYLQAYTSTNYKVWLGDVSYVKRP